ncbi:MAG: proline dehydrogenase family protein [Methanosarcinales archaeon]|nr:proline dehydrogenase family protein [ANME-2 cluster archaeon]MDW7776689.1 proline dehydrogenase family protein [Methanosarcinales archaeon]
MGILIHLAKRWVAGEYLEDAVERAKSANTRGITGIINHVGEHNENISEIEASAEEYSRLLDGIKQEQIDSAISIKLTQLGLMKDVQTCIRTIEPLIRKAADLDIFIWIDMEGSAYTQDIIDIYKQLYTENKNIGLAIQAYLFRTPDDLKDLSVIGAKIRLCKGAYKEPSDIAIKEHCDIRKAYADQMEMLFRDGGPELIAVATHDDELIELARQLNRDHPRNFEFQMLMGAHDKRKEELARDGYRVCGYIPYGKGWLGYFLRRLNEQKRDIKTAVVCVIKGD